MESPGELCGRCHGNLRFPNTDHLSYNTLQAELKEARHNLEHAESDESESGIHNRKYLMSLLNDANEKALEILTALGRQQPGDRSH